jgi:hypothetical protein
LLSEDLSKLIEQILKNVTELNHVGSMAEATERKPEEQGCFLKRHAEIREWLIAQQQPLLEKFKPFLSDWST